MPTSNSNPLANSKSSGLHQFEIGPANHDILWFVMVMFCTFFLVGDSQKTYFSLIKWKKWKLIFCKQQATISFGDYYFVMPRSTFVQTMM
jgi:hypothetical protein